MSPARTPYCATHSEAVGWVRAACNSCIAALALSPSPLRQVLAPLWDRKELRIVRSHEPPCGAWLQPHLGTA